VPNRSPIDPMPEATYLTREVLPEYRLLIRYFYTRAQAYQYHVGAPELAQALRIPEEQLHRYLDQLEAWGALTQVPEAVTPTSLQDLLKKPRIYRASRLVLALEALRIQQEGAEEGVALNPTDLERLASAIDELLTHIEADGLHQVDQTVTQAKWQAIQDPFGRFTTQVRNYLHDLPAHRPKETLDWQGFLAYKDLIVRYLTEWARRLFDQRERLRVVLRRLAPHRDLLAACLASVEAAQVRSHGQTGDYARLVERLTGEIDGLIAYWDQEADQVLRQVQGWIQEVTRHARRLSEQHHGDSPQAEVLLHLARRFADAPNLAAASALGALYFGATTPLHYKGEVPAGDDRPTWGRPALTIPLQAVKRGKRAAGERTLTPDRSAEQAALMAADAVARQQRAEALAALFGPDDRLELQALRLADPNLRQDLLRLLYKALAAEGEAWVGHAGWRLRLEEARDEAGRIEAPDGVVLLPRLRLQLLRGGRGR
jgi:uncharacterized protein (TIGR02677 family)